MIYGHASYEDAEQYSGTFPTREEAIAEGTTEYGGEPFYVMAGESPEAASLMPDADHILDIMAGNAHDNYGHDLTEDFPEVTEEAKAELDALLKDWANKHVEVTFWEAVGTPERIEPEEQDHA